MRCVVSYADGKWYSAGARRLSTILSETDPDIDQFIRIDKLPPLSRPHKLVPYEFKPYSFLDAIEKGYTSVLWLDSSVVPTRSIKPIFEHIEEHGYFLLNNAGWNTGTWTADSALEPLGITREESFTIPHGMGGILGFDFSRPEVLKVFTQWLDSSGKAFVGAWTNEAKQVSQDERVLGHRHDQTAISVFAHKAGWTFTDGEAGKWVRYNKYPEFLLNLYPAL